MGARRRCCCGRDCLIFEDDFGGAPSTNIGDNWTEDVGDWTLAVNEDCDGSEAEVLRAPAQIGAIAASTHESHTKAQWVQVTLCDPHASLVKPRILVNYKSPTDHFYIEIEQYDCHICAADGTVLVSASDSPLASVAEKFGWQNNRTYTVCVTKSGGISVQCEELIYTELQTCVALGAGKKVGLGNGAALSYDVDLFRLEDHYDYDIECPYCCCQECGNECVPHCLQVALSSVECYEFPHGETFQISKLNDVDSCNWDPINGSDEPCWDADDSYHFRLGCDENNESWEAFTLQTDVDGGCPSLYGQGLETYYPVAGSCEPFYLRFEIADWGQPDCQPASTGTLIVEITEAP